jgi:hypothetical protein
MFSDMADRVRSASSQQAEYIEHGLQLLLQVLVQRVFGLDNLVLPVLRVGGVPLDMQILEHGVQAVRQYQSRLHRAFSQMQLLGSSVCGGFQQQQMFLAHTVVCMPLFYLSYINWI